MTPLQMQMMLHYYTSPAPYAKHDLLHASSSAVYSQRNELVSWGLLTSISFNDFAITPRGEAYIRKLKEVPIPSAPKEFIIVVGGPHGAGKSTLLKFISREIANCGGDVVIDDCEPILHVTLSEEVVQRILSSENI